LDEFVEDSVMRWVRMIVARQPDAEFVFIATKEDALRDNNVTEKLLKECLMAKLQQVNATARQMKGLKEKDARLADDTPMGLTGWRKMMADQLKVESQGNPSHMPNGRVAVPPQRTLCRVCELHIARLGSRCNDQDQRLDHQE
jgi:hypothetical protein